MKRIEHRWLKVVLVLLLSAGSVARAEHEVAGTSVQYSQAELRNALLEWMEWLVEGAELEDVRGLLYLMMYSDDEALMLSDFIGFHRLWWTASPSLREEMILSLDTVWVAWNPGASR